MSPTTGLVARESEIGFTICFDWVMRATRSAMATWLYGLIWRYAQMRERHCYASCAHLAEDMGVSRYHVMKLLRLLRTMGLIECVNPAARGVTHRYVPIPEDAWRAAHGLTPRHAAANPADPQPCDPQPQPEPPLHTPTSDPQTHPLVTPTNNRCDPRQQPPVATVDTRITIGNTIENERNSMYMRKPALSSGQSQSPTPALARRAAQAPETHSARAKSKPSSRKADPRTRSPAIQAIRAVTGAYPSRGAYADLIAALGEKPDLPRLQECYAAWCARGYNPRGLNWALQWYAEGRIPSFGGQRTRSQRGVHNDEWDDDEFARWADYHDRVKKGEDPDAVKRDLGL